ncbi:MAG: hypothetical protein N5P05_002090 [Chroococcopsis gigantea SAG 12.99]|jgi:phosphoglycolate phosphatase-like HAD superfamily hydrolase|nr:HAD family hydrolase [Chlorogloea purpurea SAG 13.99]MDV3000484.1 hypothetical protein [Chroococcopsis gigantea SAG 12.99]
MLYDTPALIALDFDGVICDGIREYFQVSKRVHDLIWYYENPAPETLEPQFIKLRPVIETGWEMPLLLRAINLKFSDEHILSEWPEITQHLLYVMSLDTIHHPNFQKQELSKLLDGIRDRWIAEDLDSWLSLHQFYGGMIDKLSRLLRSPTQVYIISTKEDRFISQLLALAGIDFPSSNLFGKEVKQPKYETLRQILKETNINPENTWFIEDRLEALELVTGQPDLDQVNLYLADWGYNTAKARDSLKSNPRIKLLSLEEFTSC